MADWTCSALGLTSCQKLNVSQICVIIALHNHGAADDARCVQIADMLHVAAGVIGAARGMNSNSDRSHSASGRLLSFFARCGSAASVLNPPCLLHLPRGAQIPLTNALQETLTEEGYADEQRRRASCAVLREAIR